MSYSRSYGPKYSKKRGAQRRTYNYKKTAHRSGWVGGRANAITKAVSGNKLTTTMTLKGTDTWGPQTLTNYPSWVTTNQQFREVQDLLTNSANISGVKQIYDQYRITRVTIRYTPTTELANGAGPYKSLSTLYVVYDADATIASIPPINDAGYLKYSTCKAFNSAKEWTYSVKCDQEAKDIWYDLQFATGYVPFPGAIGIWGSFQPALTSGQVYGFVTWELEVMLRGQLV